jgi:hypothetical protein
MAVSTPGIEALRGGCGAVWEIEEVEEAAGGSGWGSLVDDDTREERPWDGRFRPCLVVTMEDLEDLDFLG